MAVIKIYRLAYTFDNGENIADITFSGWIRAEEKDALLAYVEASGDVAPIVIGWDEMVMDTEPF